MSPEPTDSAILVAVTPDVPDAVVDVAAEFAARLNVPLFAAWVDATRYTVEVLADGTVFSLPMDPDLPDLGDAGFPADLAERIAGRVAAFGIEHTLRRLAGDPARALGELAESVGALMIVVGTRKATLGRTLHDLFGGSVAVQLAHRQHRPVMVVPLHPTPFDRALPWDSPSTPER